MKLNATLGIQRALLCITLLCLALTGVAKNNLNAPPQSVTQTIENARLMGWSTLRWLGLRIYDGQLWSNTEPEAFNYQRDPSWLELKYARDFSGTDIAKRSVDEIKNLGFSNEAQRQNWRIKLEAIFPNVKKGDTLSALFTPNKGIQFFHNGTALTRLDNPELALAFMGIWLDPKTSEPEMRRELIGLSHIKLPHF